MLRFIGLVVLTIQAPDATVVLQAGVRGPAISATGRLAFELNGDLWVADMPHAADEKNPHDYTFEVWERKGAGSG